MIMVGAPARRQRGPVLFIDRDGTLIQHHSTHVTSREHIEFIPGVLDALRVLNDTEFAIAVISNQSSVSRGVQDEASMVALHEYFLQEVAAAGGRIDVSYLCPHQPDDRCGCRKPQLEMYKAAAEALGAPVTPSTMVGDAACDIEAAIAIGARPALVLTGLGEATAEALAAAELLDRCDIYPSFCELTAHVVRTLRA